jgi:hypothetical protein
VRQVAMATKILYGDAWCNAEVLQIAVATKFGMLTSGVVM